MKIFINSFKRKKVFRLYLIYFVIIITFIISILSIYFGINDKIQLKSEDITNRELIVSTRDNYDLIKKNIIKNAFISDVYKFIRPINSRAVINNIECNLIMFPIKNNIKSKIVYGRSFNYGEENSVILPIKNYEEQKLDHTIFLNQTIVFELGLNNIDYTAKVIGFHNGENDIVYFPYYDAQNFIMYSEQSDELHDYIIVIDKYKNVEKSIDKLESLGYYAELLNSTVQKEINIYITLKNLVSLILIILLSLTYIILLLLVSNIVHDERYDIAILKSIGYNDKAILIVTIIKTAFLLTVSISLSILISLILNITITNNFFDINIKQFLSSVLVTIMGIILIHFSSTVVFLKKIKKISPISILKR